MLVPGLVLIALGLALFARAPVDAGYVADLLPAMLLLGVGAGLSFPALMTLAMSGATRATPAWPPGWSTPPCRSAARWAWPCWRRCPPRAPSDLLAEGVARRRR